jgi:hypothetical protein
MAEEPDQIDPSNPWGLEPQESGFVAFWPHVEPPTMEEVTGAMATWAGDASAASQQGSASDGGDDADPDSQEEDESEDRFKVQQLEPDGDANWCCAVHVPGITHALVVWCEPARALSDAERAQLGDGAARAKWVIRVQTVLHAPDAAEDYFMAVGMVAGSLPDIVALLDVVTSEVFDRATLDRLFVAEGAKPMDRVLWRLGRYEALADGDPSTVLVGTCGLSRCGLPELEMSEVPRDQADAAAVLLHTLAGLLLESPAPPPGFEIEIGDGIRITLQRADEVAVHLTEGSPGSRAWRDVARSHGLAEFELPRAAVCGTEPRGAFKPVWMWPQDAVERIASGSAVLFMTRHSVEAATQRAQSTWPTFATAFASLARPTHPDWQKMAEDAFQVQAAVPPPPEGHSGPRIEQAWFHVRRIAGDGIHAMTSSRPVTRPDLDAGSMVLLKARDVTDWRVELDGHVYDPDESDALLHAVDRVRGLAESE